MHLVAHLKLHEFVIVDHIMETAHVNGVLAKIEIDTLSAPVQPSQICPIVLTRSTKFKHQEQKKIRFAKPSCVSVPRVEK